MIGSLFVNYSSPALSEIDEIYEYIAKDNPQAAADILAAINEAIELLRRYPYKSRKTR